jgi:hypothetical protein
MTAMATSRDAVSFGSRALVMTRVNNGQETVIALTEFDGRGTSTHSGALTWS